METASISPRDAALTPSKKLEAHGEFRIRFMNKLLSATKINDGKKYAKRCKQCAGNASKQITDERCGGEHRSRRGFDPIAIALDQLFIGQPAQVSTKSARRNASRT